MARSSRTGGKTYAATRRKAGPVKGRNPKTQPVKALKTERSGEKTSRTKPSITDLQEQLGRQARELEETRQQQAASCEVLQIISSSAGALKPVFQAITKSAVDLCKARFGAVFRMEGDLLHLVTDYNFGASQRQLLGAMYPMKPSRGHISGRAILAGSTVQIPDIYADEDYKSVEAKKAGFRSLLAAPLLQGHRAIGSIVIYRTEPGAFTAGQLTLLQNFAAQAVIAIENARLFNEVQAKTHDLEQSLQQQTATADVLKVISRSAFDLQAVLHTLVESAALLSGANQGTITRQKDGKFYRVESFNHSREFMDYVRDIPVALDRGSASGRALLAGDVVHITDVLADPEYTFNEAQRLSGLRTCLGVPVLREGIPVGVISLTRSEVSPFTDKQIELVKTFADQAAIAIENARLFEEVQARTRELAKSLDDLRAAQDRLIQTEKLASLGQLTAGIAHEIKNPLNFVNNFAALSAELTCELKDALKPVVLDETIRAEVDEISDLLKNNLDKVVQHGKRADSIVKNMLLHSREGSGEQRSADINAIVEDSLNLAYHGARAEKSGFEITLQRDFDANAGKLELFPQEISRALLNLISNGFYAATKQKAEKGRAGFEPTVLAATKDLGDSVEVRIRDNGAGIPPEVREKMFNPFFTTKPTGEGTGLGLSMTYDIIVKQHGGRIDVETRLGEFTEFIITLPRNYRTAGG
jgi:two-component system, NtrC family, sensor kinase